MKWGSGELYTVRFWDLATLPKAGGGTEGVLWVNDRLKERTVCQVGWWKWEGAEGTAGQPHLTAQAGARMEVQAKVDLKEMHLNKNNSIFDPK